MTKTSTVSVQHACPTFSIGHSTYLFLTENEKPDWLVTLACCFNMFAVLVNYAASETTSTPVVMDQFAWPRQVAVQNMGITMAVGGVIGGCFFASVGPLSKRIDERKLLIFMGFIPLIASKVVYLPMSRYNPQLSGNFTVGGRNTSIF